MTTPSSTDLAREMAENICGEIGVLGSAQDVRINIVAQALLSVAKKAREYAIEECADKCEHFGEDEMAIVIRDMLADKGTK